MTSIMKQLKDRRSSNARPEIDVSEIITDLKVHVRQLNNDDREWMMDAMTFVPVDGQMLPKPSVKARCRQVVRSLVDADGKRLMTDLDVDALMKECSSSDLDLIGSRIDQAFAPAPSMEDAEKN